MSEDKNCWVPKTPGAAPEVRTPPIDFIGDWDSVVVEHKQIAYQESGFRVWLTEKQIDELIATRRRVRSEIGHELTGVPYFRAFEDEPNSGLYVRRLNGVETVGYLGENAEWIEAA